jgi:hypothetical protein
LGSFGTGIDNPPERLLNRMGWLYIVSVLAEKRPARHEKQCLDLTMKKSKFHIAEHLPNRVTDEYIDVFSKYHF